MDEADLLRVGVETVGLGIDGDSGCDFESGENRGELIGMLDHGGIVRLRRREKGSLRMRSSGEWTADAGERPVGDAAFFGWGACGRLDSAEGGALNFQNCIY